MALLVAVATATAAGYSALVPANANRRRRHAAFSAEDRDRQLHPRHACRARRSGRGPARAGRIRAFRTQRARANPPFARGPAARASPAAAAAGARLAHGMEQARPAAGGDVPRPARRLPLLGLDVPGAARGPARDDDPRPRPTALSGLGEARDGAH